MYNSKMWGTPLQAMVCLALLRMCICLTDGNGGSCTLPLANDTSNKQEECDLRSGRACTVPEENKERDTGDSSPPPRNYAKWWDVKAGQYGYLVGILKEDGEFACGGVVIRPRYVLSAGPCIHKFGKNPTVAVGFTGIDEKGTAMAAQFQPVRHLEKHHLHLGEADPNGYPAGEVDAVLLELESAAGLDVEDLPVTAVSTYVIDNNQTVISFRLGPPHPYTRRRALQAAAFPAANFKHCQGMPNQTNSMSCVISSSATLWEDYLGYPIVHMGHIPDPTIDLPQEDWSGAPDLALIVGVVSHLQFYVEAGAVRAMDIVEWMNEVTVGTNNQPHSYQVGFVMALIIWTLIFVMLATCVKKMAARAMMVTTFSFGQLVKFTVAAAVAYKLGIPMEAVLPVMLNDNNTERGLHSAGVSRQQVSVPLNHKFSMLDGSEAFVRIANAKLGEWATGNVCKGVIWVQTALECAVAAKISVDAATELRNSQEEYDVQRRCQSHDN
eukprot:evm.model.scf_489.1 EVM.evm.TU.scf_489.1   scf_489:1729-7085(+)